MPGTVTINGNTILSLLSRDIGIPWFINYKTRLGNSGGCRSCNRNTADQFNVFNAFKQALAAASPEDKQKVKQALHADKVQLIIRGASGIVRYEF